MTEDRLMSALKMLADDTGAYDMITWCPEQHVLSFRRVGSWQWVNLWLHAGPEIDEHHAEPNGGEYGWGGTAPTVLWIDGKRADGGGWVYNIPKRRADGIQNPVESCFRAEHFTELPPVPGASK